jgi:phenylpropionate dioxygenase-like ring-hydroxylating dioxygenase large terminal subunit
VTTQIENPAARGAGEVELPEVEVIPLLPDPSVDTSNVPFRMVDGVHIPADRYYDQEFARLENRKLWMHTWMWAARVEDVQMPGDYIEFQVAEESVMVVRVDEETIKVFHNVCPHRATQLAIDCGSFSGKQIVCPFHGWRWNLDGTQSYLYARNGFVADSIDPSKINLKEVRSEIRHGFVWINFDDEAQSLGEFLGDMEQHLEPMWLDKMRVRWWKYIDLDANWKVATEAFIEAYHVMQAHPELAFYAVGDDYDADKLAYHPKGNGHFNVGAVEQPEGYTPPVKDIPFGQFFLEQNRVMFEGTDAYITQREEFISDRVRHQDIPDEALVTTFFEEYYAYAQDAGITLPPLNPDASGYGFIFPNMVFLGFTGNLLLYRIRPVGTDPNVCRFEVFALQIPIEAEGEQAPARAEGPLAVADLPFVLRQDVENIARQQAGYRSSAFTETTMSPRFEKMIFGMHNEIDRYLAQ